jgi:hypothetical protein
MAEPNPDKIRRLADEEAARAEAESPEPEQEGEEAETEEGQPEQAPEPDGSPEEAEQLARVADLEKAQTRYLRAVEKIIGPEGMPPLCPVCQGTGLDFSGGQPEPEYKDSPRDVTCPDCEGWGKVRTGSRVQGEEVQACPTCTGRGAVAKGATLVTAPAPGDAGGTPGWMGDPNVSSGVR